MYKQENRRFKLIAVLMLMMLVLSNILIPFDAEAKSKNSRGYHVGISKVFGYNSYFAKKKQSAMNSWKKFAKKTKSN